MDKDIAIRVSKVSKDFKLPHEKADSIKSIFVNPFNKDRKKFETQHALHDISFDVHKGEFFGIVGRNGSGKSTLLKIIAGIYQANSGSVQVNGRLVPFIELGVGFNPQLTGRENVYLNGALLGFSEKEVDAKYDSIVDFAELERFMDQKLKNYSSGMQVRLAFSVATILAESDILLIDEVLAVGDADFQRKCFGYFKKLKKENKTVIFVSHDMSSVREYCDRAVLIDNSIIKHKGRAEDIATDYMKMFNESGQLKVADSQRWGSGEIKYISEPNIKIRGDEVTITVKSKSKDDLNDVIYGFLIKNQAGESVLGTNSKIINEKTENTIGGKALSSEWKFSNIFSSGEYSLTVSITSSDGATVYDWWVDAAYYSINNQRNTPYIVSPAISMTNSRNGS